MLRPTYQNLEECPIYNNTALSTGFSCQKKNKKDACLFTGCESYRMTYRPTNLGPSAFPNSEKERHSVDGLCAPITSGSNVASRPIGIHLPIAGSVVGCILGHPSYDICLPKGCSSTSRRFFTMFTHNPRFLQLNFAHPME